MLGCGKNVHFAASYELFNFRKDLINTFVYYHYSDPIIPVQQVLSVFGAIFIQWGVYIQNSHYEYTWSFGDEDLS